VGHGTLLTLFAIFMIVNEKKYLKQQEDGTINEMFGMAFSGRYMMVLMGFFGVYVGSLCMRVSVFEFIYVGVYVCMALMMFCVFMCLCRRLHMCV
jgi:dolichyl-phosphate-mannose--protein O-mannosyl transferase